METQCHSTCGKGDQFMTSIVGEFSGVTAATPTGLSEPSLVRWSLIGLTLAYLVVTSFLDV